MNKYTKKLINEGILEYGDVIRNKGRISIYNPIEEKENTFYGLRSKRALRVIKEIYNEIVLEEQRRIPKLRKSLKRETDFKAFNELARINYRFTDVELRRIKKKLNPRRGEKNVAEIEINNELGEKEYITLNQEGIELLLDSIKSYSRETESDSYESETFTKISKEGLKSIKVSRIEEGDHKIINRSGAFFKYENKSNIVLTKYQILRKNDIKKKQELYKLLNKNCLIHTLEQYGINESLINNVISATTGGQYITKSSLFKIAEIIKHTIELTFLDKKEKLRRVSYGKYDKVLQIALYREHYFKLEKTKYTRFFIKNYPILKDVKNNNEIIQIRKIHNKINYVRSKKETYKASSLEVIKGLFNLGYMTSKTDIFNGVNNKITVKPNISLDNIEAEQCLITKKKKKREIEYYPIFGADFESDVRGETHIGILGGVMDIEKEEPKIFSRTDRNPLKWLYGVLNYVKESTQNYMIESERKSVAVVYIHNLKYDYKGLIEGFVNTESIVEKDGVVYCVNINFYGCKIQLRDSYKLIPNPLRDFKGMFGLSENMCKKEMIAYEYYDKDKMRTRRVKVSDYLKYLYKNQDFFENKESFISHKELTRKSFLKILNENKKIFEFDDVKMKFNPMKYYKYYLKYDVMVLVAGLNKFRSIMSDIIGGTEDPLGSLTISSLSHNYMINSGCYDDVYQLGGNIRQYVSGALYGGRTNCCEKFRKKIINKKIQDFDGVSLYPSAMSRMCNDAGVPKGKAKVLKNKEELNNYDYYIVTIKITKINKKQQNPFIAVKDMKGILRYINEVDEKKGEITRVDKITLEDYIKFHEIEYEIIDGIYWNKGFNKKLGKTIKSLFDERLKYKKKVKECTNEVERNGANCTQKLIKLMLNSAYGKTMLKKTNTVIKYRKKNRFNKEKKIYERDDMLMKNYLYNNFNKIVSFQSINDNLFRVKEYELDTSYNLGHVGVMVLSWSKRIMNEVMDVSNDNDINIYYQDTDSLHMEDADVKKLQSKFKEKYNRELVGKNLGQFHSDFELSYKDYSESKKYDGEDIKGFYNVRQAKNVMSVKSIFLSKKCYYDKLQGVGINGETVSGEHYRMKGINKTSILNESFKSGYFGKVEKIYERLINEEIEFILNPKGKAMFEYVEGGIRTRDIDEFKRTITFK